MSDRRPQRRGDLVGGPGLGFVFGNDRSPEAWETRTTLRMGMPRFAAVATAPRRILGDRERPRSQDVSIAWEAVNAWMTEPADALQRLGRLDPSAT